MEEEHLQDRSKNASTCVLYEKGDSYDGISEGILCKHLPKCFCVCWIPSQTSDHYYDRIVAE